MLFHHFKETYVLDPLDDYVPDGSQVTSSQTSGVSSSQIFEASVCSTSYLEALNMFFGLVGANPIKQLKTV